MKSSKAEGIVSWPHEKTCSIIVCWEIYLGFFFLPICPKRYFQFTHKMPVCTPRTRCLFAHHIQDACLHALCPFTLLILGIFLCCVTQPGVWQGCLVEWMTLGVSYLSCLPFGAHHWSYSHKVCQIGSPTNFLQRSLDWYFIFFKFFYFIF